jgi:hypothetical protein
MIKEIIKIIHALRVLFFALILVSFLFYLGINPIDVGRYVGSRFSYAVGIGTSASITPNPFNTLALQLKEKENKLDAREKTVDQKESDLRSALLLQNRLLWVLLIGIVILFVLIVVNFFMDWKRRKIQNSGKK